MPNETSTGSAGIRAGVNIDTDFGANHAVAAVVLGALVLLVAIRKGFKPLLNS